MGQHVSSVSSSTTPAAYPEEEPLTFAEAKNLPLVPHGVYALLSQHVYRDPINCPQLPAGWSILVTAEDVQLEREGYFATAYINERIRHVVVAERGTVDAHGVRTGIWIYFDAPTVQFGLAEEFSKVVRLRLQINYATNTDAVPFTISYTGHSLGAVLATCRACAERTFAVTFESPGCRSFVEKTMHPFKVEDSDVISYVRPPNPINTLKPHVGYVVQLPPGSATITLPSPPNPQVGPDGVAPMNPAIVNQAAEREEKEKAAAASKSGTTLKFPTLPSFPSLPAAAQDYINRKVLEKSIPEYLQHFTKLEPLLREMFDHTQQVHSIAGIVEDFMSSTSPGRELLFEPGNVDTVLIWPKNILQYIELNYNTKTREACPSSQYHARNAYNIIIQTLYSTSRRDLYAIPSEYLNPETRRLLYAWSSLSRVHRLMISMDSVDRRALASARIEGQSMVAMTGGVTAFQLKQYFAIRVMQSPEWVLSITSAAQTPGSKL